MQLQTTAGHPTFQFGEIFGDYFVGTAWSSVTSPAQCAVCGHQLGFLLLQVASNKYYSTGGGFEGRSPGSGESRRLQTGRKWTAVPSKSCPGDDTIHNTGLGRWVKIQRDARCLDKPMEKSHNVTLNRLLGSLSVCVLTMCGVVVEQ